MENRFSSSLAAFLRARCYHLLQPPKTCLQTPHKHGAGGAHAGETSGLSRLSQQWKRRITCSASLQFPAGVTLKNLTPGPAHGSSPDHPTPFPVHEQGSAVPHAHGEGKNMGYLAVGLAYDIPCLCTWVTHFFSFGLFFQTLAQGNNLFPFYSSNSNQHDCSHQMHSYGQAPWFAKVHIVHLCW